MPISEPPNPRLVLLVEDERTQRMILRTALERDGFAVAESEDGAQALRAFDSSKPDVVLLDVGMPVMDGYATCAALRQRQGGNRVPIVMLTVLDDIDSINRSYEAGATDFITKPCAWPVLGHRLRYMLRASDAFAALARSEEDLGRRVAARTAELEAASLKLKAANRELEAFTESVAHDLHAPLRAISGFTAMVLEANHGRLEQTSIDHLERVQASGDRMRQLIDDLLDLSRISQHELRRQNTDLTALARKVAAALAKANPRWTARVTVGPDIVANADLRLMRVVLENLIGNALKFCEKIDAASIEFNCEHRSGRTVYYIRDNGVGFDMRYVGKLFRAFQRLHKREEFEGTGIGLCIVKRIVDLHGGEVWVDAKQGAGATFSFSLGAANDAAAQQRH